MYLKGVKDSLKNINNEFQKECKNAVDRSHHISLSRLKPGEAAPAPGFLTPEIQEELRASVGRLANRAQAVLEDALREVREAKAEAPSTEAVNAITMLRGNKHVSESELNALMEVYGDNYLTHKAICDLAREHNATLFPPHPAQGLEEGLVNLSRIYRRDLTIYEADKMASSTWRKSVMDADVDENLPG